MTRTLGSWKLLFVVVLLSAVGASQLAAAKTLCVNPGGTKGCFSKINDAIAAAKPRDIINVAAGTYNEQVVIGKSLSLIGAGSATTFVNAAGLCKTNLQCSAFYIDGLDNPGLSDVVLQGFTAENADFEGIAVTSASNVTIWGNHIYHNDRALDVKDSSCPGLLPWETSEGLDCGEGIHLSGVTYSTISNNVADRNSGGILVSDETGVTEYNVIAGNTLKNNVYDCGITIPSHPPFNNSKPWGVRYNTISGNTSTGNGTAVAGAGAGILFAGFLPGATVSGNSVVNNTLSHNGLPGVTVHAHGTGEIITNNMIVGNTISYNGADTGDAVTPGPTGINVFGVSALKGFVISQNAISHESYDIVANTPALVTVHLNNLLGAGQVGVDNIGKGSVDATQNYWGCPGGPTKALCSSVGGPKVTFEPFLAKAY
jgi:parallel beta-helix repeat protein